MSKVLLLVAHPDLSRSRHNAALVAAAEDLEHVTVHDLYATYPGFSIDADAERALLAEHDVVVFQHPVHWYNLPPLLRQWQDDVLTYGWAFNYDGSPTRTTGKKALVAVTAGGSAEAYSAQGPNRYTVDEFLWNWDATLRLCQMDVQPSFRLLGTAFGLSPEEVFLAAKEYRELLQSYA